MKWEVIAPLTLCITPLILPAIESGVFAFASHQNCCNHDAQLANNNPCCLLHQPVKSLSIQTYQWYGLQTQSNINVNAVNSHKKIAFALGMSYHQVQQLKQIQLSSGLGLVFKPHFLIGLQIKGSHNQWHNFNAYKIAINLAYQWQINSHYTWIGLIEKIPILPHETLPQRISPVISMALQKTMHSQLSLQINFSNSIFGQLKFGGHMYLKQGSKEWVFSISDNLQQSGLAVKSYFKQHINWGIGCLYHWQLGLSTHSQLSYVF